MLTRVFREGFTADEKARVREHLAAGETVLCGELWYAYFGLDAG